MIIDFFNEKHLYLILNIGAIIGPLALSFHPRSKFYKTWEATFPAIFLVGFLFVIWDIAFTKMGIWGFNPRYLSGFYLVNLPIEEVLFFITVPYACLFSYHSVKVLTSSSVFTSSVPWISGILMVLSLVVGVWFYYRLYTVVTFIALLTYTIWVAVWLRKPFVGRFYFTYLLILIPFVIMNGVLTGTGIDEEVVWYAGNQHIGLRILTIPIEDTFYGMLLIFMNVSLYEFFLFLMHNKHQDWQRA